MLWKENAKSHYAAIQILHHLIKLLSAVLHRRKKTYVEFVQLMQSLTKVLSDAFLWWNLNSILIFNQKKLMTDNFWTIESGWLFKCIVGCVVAKNIPFFFSVVCYLIHNWNCAFFSL